ncbi:putative GNAT superfamily acetyltransferase [Nocardioides thalensis]|uniref:Putative GNAT superfamily acetyltransferase n=1 Tax=Nocardioides thalensis TaxID=1914755 RepID=A0A853BZT4_9ACTN|nr:GNAT family N-acetyltransferase [Nocardioides thalensis]NYI99642.1 putative GNAT superfamily acetyltransferase [Nocardioides thalensis]
MSPTETGSSHVPRAADDAARREHARTTWLRAQEQAGVSVRPLETIDELRQLEELFTEIWGPRRGDSMISREVLRALSSSGNYVVGAYLGDAIVGGCVGFAARSDVPSLHSHIAGVRGAAQGRNVGFTMKLHQRDWAMRSGFRRIEWTFDPLVRRNAYFNVAKLGGRPVRYLPDFYGPMDDGINADTASDRVLLRWEIYEDPPGGSGSPARQLLAIGQDDEPEWIEGDRAGVRAEGAVTRYAIQVPDDIERIRRSAPDLADRWRRALRKALGGLLDDGAEVATFSTVEGYVVDAVR